MAGGGLFYWMRRFGVKATVVTSDNSSWVLLSYYCLAVASNSGTLCNPNTLVPLLIDWRCIKYGRIAVFGSHCYCGQPIKNAAYRELFCDTHPYLAAKLTRKNKTVTVTAVKEGIWILGNDVSTLYRSQWREKNNNSFIWHQLFTLHHLLKSTHCAVSPLNHRSPPLWYWIISGIKSTHGCARPKNLTWIIHNHLPWISALNKTQKSEEVRFVCLF